MNNSSSGYPLDIASIRRKFLLATGALARSNLLASTVTAATHSEQGARAASRGTSSAENETAWPQHRYNDTGYHPTAQGPRTDLEERWRFEANTIVGPVVSDNVVYASGQVPDPDTDEPPAGLYAMDATDGTPLWIVDPEMEVDALAVDDRHVYASGGSLRAYSRSDGSIQ